MNILLTPRCWVTRHHWLLQTQLPTFQPHVYTYSYQCQVCGKWSDQLVKHLDGEQPSVTDKESI